MVRLIDADATIYALNVASRGDSKDVIRNLVICFLLASPTVDAIPIEWMLNDWNPKELEDVGYQVMRRIIADWEERRKE